MDAQLVFILRNHPMLSCLGLAEWREIAGQSAPIDLEEGQHLFTQGGVADHVFLLLAGTVSLRDASWLEGGVLSLTAGAVLATEALVPDALYSCSAIAGASTRAWPIMAANLRQRLDARFDAALAMIATVSGSLRHRIKEISAFKMQSTTERLATFLAELAGVHEGPAEIRLHCTKRALADQLGMDPATLSRSLAKLRSIGVTAGSGDLVRVADVGRLREAAAMDHQHFVPGVVS